MAEFKKIEIEIDSETFDAIYKKVYEAFVNADNETFNEDIKEALEKTVFDVKDPFDIEKWNSCTVKLPSNLEAADLIIRKVGVDSITGVNATNDYQGSYYIGWYVVGGFSVSGDYEESKQDDIEEQIRKHPEKWEYRVIPFK